MHNSPKTCSHRLCVSLQMNKRCFNCFLYRILLLVSWQWGRGSVVKHLGFLSLPHWLFLWFYVLYYFSYRDKLTQTVIVSREGCANKNSCSPRKTYLFKSELSIRNVILFYKLSIMQPDLHRSTFPAPVQCTFTSPRSAGNLKDLQISWYIALCASLPTRDQCTYTHK